MSRFLELLLAFHLVTLQKSTQARLLQLLQHEKIISLCLPESFLPRGNAEGKSEQRTDKLEVKVLERSEANEWRERSAQINTKRKKNPHIDAGVTAMMLNIFL